MPGLLRSSEGANMAAPGPRPRVTHDNIFQSSTNRAKDATPWRSPTRGVSSSVPAQSPTRAQASSKSGGVGHSPWRSPMRPSGWPQQQQQQQQASHGSPGRYALTEDDEEMDEGTFVEDMDISDDTMDNGGGGGHTLSAPRLRQRGMPNVHRYHRGAETERAVVEVRLTRHQLRKLLLYAALVCIAFGALGLFRTGAAKRFLTDVVSVYLRLMGEIVTIYGPWVVAAIVGLFTLVAVLILWYIVAENRHAREVRTELLQRDLLLRLERAGELVIVHTRDQISWEDHSQGELWPEVEKRIAQDTRVRTLKTVIDGQEHRIWKWVGLRASQGSLPAHLLSSPTNSASAVSSPMASAVLTSPSTSVGSASVAQTFAPPIVQRAQGPGPQSQTGEEGGHIYPSLDDL